MLLCLNAFPTWANKIMLVNKQITAILILQTTQNISFIFPLFLRQKLIA